MKFQDFPYVRPDVKAVAARMSALAERFSAAETYEEAERLFLELDKADEDVLTQYTLAEIRNTLDLTDTYYETEYAFLGKEIAEMAPVNRKIAEAFCHTPFRAELEKRFGTQIFRKAEADVRLNCDANIPLKVQEQEIEIEYRKAAAGFHCSFRGEECNFYGLLRHMEAIDPAERREAAEAWADGYESIAPTLDGCYDRLVKLRVQMAKNAGFASYVDMAYCMRGRFDYDRRDVENFRSFVKKYITPQCVKASEAQAEDLGLPRLRYCDEPLVYPEGNPVPQGTPEELVAAAKKMYHEMSPRTGEFFDFMTEHELFDLVTRPNKQMGGYCSYLPGFGAPFIFSNFNGTGADVDVLTHEAGHAYQSYESAAHQELIHTFDPSFDVAEIHSMSMELFAYPWMKLFYGDRADKRVYAHLLDAFRCVPYLVCVDEFQHRVYDEPDMSALRRREVWREIEQTYMPWRNYDGNAFLESGGYWMQKLHIFLYPFYYIDYALVQICAFMMYRKSETDRPKAWRDYQALCAAGGSKGYLDLLKLANLGSPFDEKSFADTAAFIVTKLNELKK